MKSGSFGASNSQKKSSVIGKSVTSDEFESTFLAIFLLGIYSLNILDQLMEDEMNALDRCVKVIVRHEEQKLILKDPNYIRTNRKWVKKEGERVMVEQQQRVPLWWREHPNGSYALSVRSGLKPIEFEKGRSAIAVSSLDQASVRDRHLDHRHSQWRNRIGSLSRQASRRTHENPSGQRDEEDGVAFRVTPR
jgi:hypothetical protein